MRPLDCGSEGYGFKPRRPPHFSHEGPAWSGAERHQAAPRLLQRLLHGPQAPRPASTAWSRLRSTPSQSSGHYRSEVYATMDESAQPSGRAECAECGLDLPMVTGAPDQPAPPCPHCGSLRRNGFAFAGVATGTGTAGHPEAVAKEPEDDYHGGSLRKPARERRVGMSLTSDDGIERSRRRDYDRKGNWYEETILNPDGSVDNHTAEPLCDHIGHGSAKPKS